MSKCKIRKIYVTNWNWGLHLKYTTQMAPQTPQLDVSLENSEPSERSGTQWCTAHGALVSGGHSPKLAVLWCFMVENGNSLSLGHPIFRHTQLDFLMFNKYTHTHHLIIWSMYTCRGIFHSQLTCLCFGGESYLRCCESNNHCSTRGSLGRPLGETSTVSNRSAWRFGFTHWEFQKRGVSGNRLYRAIPGYTGLYHILTGQMMMKHRILA